MKQFYQIPYFAASLQMKNLHEGIYVRHFNSPFKVISDIDCVNFFCSTSYLKNYHNFRLKFRECIYFAKLTYGKFSSWFAHWYHFRQVH